MKKILCAVLTTCMLFALTACGSKPESKTVVLTYDLSGTTIDYQLDALDDTVQKITQVSTVDCSAYSDEDLSIILESADEYAASYEVIEGVTYSIEVEDSNLIETIVIDTTNLDSLQELSDSGLLPIDGDFDYISLEKTIENLESMGMTIKE